MSAPTGCATYDRPMARASHTRDDHGGAAPGRSVRRRARLLAFSLVLVVGAAGLTGCSHESLVPSSSQIVYATLGSIDANPSNKVAVVSSASGATAKPFTVGTLPSGLVLEPGAGHLLVTVKAENSLVEVDTSTGKISRHVTVGLEPDAVALTPDGSLALVADFGDATLTVVRISNFSVVTRVPVGRQPVAVAITPNGKLAVVACYLDGTLNPVALPSYVPGPPVPVGPEPLAVEIASNGRTALVAGFQKSIVTPVALPSLRPEVPIAVGFNPTDIDSLPNSPVAWVSGGNTIAPVTLATGVVGPAIGIGGPAECVAAVPGSEWVCRGDGSLVQIDATTGKIVKRVNVGGIPSHAVISPFVPL